MQNINYQENKDEPKLWLKMKCMELLIVYTLYEAWRSRSLLQNSLESGWSKSRNKGQDTWGQIFRRTTIIITTKLLGAQTFKAWALLVDLVPFYFYFHLKLKNVLHMVDFPWLSLNFIKAFKYCSPSRVIPFF